MAFGTLAMKHPLESLLSCDFIIIYYYLLFYAAPRVGLMDERQRAIVLGGGGEGALTVGERLPLLLDMVKV